MAGKYDCKEAGSGTDVGAEILKALEAKGIRVPYPVTRMVIDIGMDELVKVYYACHAEAAHIDVLKQVLAGEEIKLEVHGDGLHGEQPEGGG